MGERHALGARGGAAGELEEATSSRPIFSGLQRLDATRGSPRSATTCSSAGQLGLDGAEQALDLGVVTSSARAALGDDVARVVEVALELAEAERRVDGHGDDARADGAEEGEDEVVVVGQDERDAVALAEAERLERAAVAGARPLDGGVRERVASLPLAGLPSSGMKRKPRVGSVFAASSMAWARVRALGMGRADRRPPV